MTPFRSSHGHDLPTFNNSLARDLSIELMPVCLFFSLSSLDITLLLAQATGRESLSLPVTDFPLALTGS